MKADASFAAKFERRYHFLEVDKDANLMARRICVGESATRISDVVATRLLRQISTHYCRANRLESTVSMNEAKLFSLPATSRKWIVISSYFRTERRLNLSPREVDCRPLAVNVHVSTRFSRSKVEFLLSKVNCRLKKAWFRHCRWNLIVNKSYIAESRLLPLWDVSKRIRTPFSLSRIRYQNCCFGKYLLPH